MAVMLIQTTRAYIRPYTPEDLDNFFLLNGDEQVMQYIRKTISKEESGLFLKEIIAGYNLFPGLGRWAMIEKMTGQFMGTFSLLPLEQRKDIHIGYALLKNFWGKGYASEMVKGGLQYGYNQLKLPSIVAVTHPGNIASQKILLNNNFIYEGIYSETGKEEFIFRHMKPQDN